MEKVLAEILNKGTAPTREDIGRLLEVIGKPGENRDAKSAAVRRLYDESGHRAFSVDGRHVADDLSDYGAY